MANFSVGGGAVLMFLMAVQLGLQIFYWNILLCSLTNYHILHVIPQPKVGMLYARPQKRAQLEQVQVELREDRLVVQKCDVVYEDIMAKNVSVCDISIK